MPKCAARWPTSVARSEIARSFASALLAVGLLAGGIARLRRIERPVFDRVAVSPDGRVELGRVRVARRGENGRWIGWSVRCDRREVWSRLGAHESITLVSQPLPLHLHDVRFDRDIPLPPCP